jgi:hypothetical protein
MSKLFRVIEAAARDASRAQELVDDARGRRALRVDPEGALLAFELHTGAIDDETAEVETRNVRRDRDIRTAALS